ncbi:transport and Golgi organization protein 1 homolog isoform X2 [Callorhinchus milii]|uniref:transport and Golgi organization protein 1 homolog isoform X2 n=1 Tax=Callorhinchus milii TaxID=7868 RepID=UPI001C3FD7C4|nr:transport and Golgi organization protein 1 homolog isoform X2 [Callorhinchus milii]
MNMAAMLRAACVSLTLSLLSSPAASPHSPPQSFFSDLKRCADEECSMLMCRGKAVQDFRGPDCRFLKIKTGETIYVYYKLSGRRNNLWAGSMGSQFGYFPKDLIDVNLVYTTDEIEMPVEETDFVCFDGGPEIFDHVDLDQLGGGGWVSEAKMESHTFTNDASISKSQEEDEGSGPQALQKDIDSGFERTPKVPERNIETDGALEKLRPESSLPSNSGIETEGRDSIEDIKRNSTEILPSEDEAFEEKTTQLGENATSLEEHWVGGNEARGSGPSDLKSSKLTTDSGGLQAGSWGDGEGQSEGAKDISQGQGKQWDSTERVTLEPEQMDSLPLLETSLGSTIDAVVTDDEVTRKVTALNEEPEFDVDDAELKDVQWSESPEKVPLLTYSDDQMQQQSGFLGEDMHQEGNVDRKQVGKSVVSNAGRISDAPDLTVITVDSERSKLEPVGRMDVAIEETLDKPHRIVGKLLGNVDGSIEESMGKLHGTTDPLEKMDGVRMERLGKMDGTIEETLGNNNRVTEQVQYKTKDELPRGVSSDESGQSGGILTTLGETVYAIVSGDESTAKIIDVSSSDSNEIPERIQKSTSKDSEEARGILLLSMSKEENRLDVVGSIETDTATGERSGPTREDSRDTVTGILASDNPEMPPKKPSEAGKIIEPMSKSQDPELHKESEIKVKVLGLSEETGADEVGGEEGLEKEEEQVERFERQTLKQPDGEALMETGSSGKVGQTESDTKVDNSSASRIFENRSAEDGDTTSQDGTDGVLGQGRPSAQELGPEESRGEATMDRAKMGVNSEESLSQEAAGLLEGREGTMNEPGDDGKKTGKPLESGLEPEVDTIQEEMDEEQFNLPEEEAFDEEPYFVDSEEHEELLEDENAVVARMLGRDNLGGAAAADNDDEQPSDAQEMGAASWVEDVDLQNATELEDNEFAFETLPTESAHDAKTQGELSGTKGEKRPTPLDFQQPEGLRGENLDHSLERSSEVGGKVAGHRGQGKSQPSEENILEEDGRDLEGKDPLNSAKVKEKEEFEDTVYGNKNTDLEDEDKIIADPEFNESVQQLTFLKLYFNEDHLKRLYGYFGLQHLLELEAMFLDLEEELRVTKHTNTGGDLEKALDNVLEVSESKILDQIENMLDQRAEMEGLHVEEDPHYDKETMLLDDIQELLYQIRQKYSTSRDSTLLAPTVNTPQEDKQLPSDESLEPSQPGEGEKEQSLSQRTQGEEEAEAAKELPSSNVMGDATQQIEEEEDDDEEMEDGEDEKVAIPHSPNLTESGVQEEELQDEVEGEFSSSNLTASFAREEGMGEKGEEVAAGKPRAADRGRGEEPAEKSLGMKRSPSLTESAAQHEREEEHSEETSRVQQPPNFTQSAAQQRKEEEEGEKVVGDETDQAPRFAGFSGNMSKGQEDSPSVNSTEGDLHPLEKWDQGNGTERKVGSFEAGGYTGPTEQEPSSPISIENAGMSDSEGVEKEALRKEKQQQEAKFTTPAKESDEMGHRTEELETREPSFSLDNTVVTDSQQLPWIIGLLDSVISVIKENGWPLLQPVAEFFVSTLPEDMKPGPDFYGLPWEPVLMTVFVGILTLLIFFWRTCLSVKSRRYQMTEKQLSDKIQQLIQEKAEVLDKVSTYENKLQEAKYVMEDAQKVNATVSDESKEIRESCRELEQVNLHLEKRVKDLQASLDKEKQQSTKQQDLILETQNSVKKLQEAISLHSVELSQLQESLYKAKSREERAHSDLQSVLEENAQLKQSKDQLLKEAEGWSERHGELNEQIKLCQKAQRDLEETLVYKDNEIEVLTDCVMQLRQLDADSDNDVGYGWDKEVESEMPNGEPPDKTKRAKMKIQQMMDVSRVKTTLKIIEEERDHFQAKLCDEIKARHELEEQIQQLEHDYVSTGTERSRLENEFKTMQQKLEILTELYHQKEMALQKKLTQEEVQRQEKEQKLSVADERALQAVEEVKMYKQRIQEMEEELQKTERSFKNQIATHEKKAHENWLSARTAERTLTEEKRESANLRQRLIELNQKLSQIQRPSIIKPTPGRPDRQVPPGAPPPLGVPRRGPLSRDDSYGPSPVSGGAPSPPLMMELPGRPPSVNAGRGFPRDRGDAALRGPSGPPPPREWTGPGSDRLGHSSDHGSPPPPWDRRLPGPPAGPIDGHPGPRRPPSESGRISGPGEIHRQPSPSRAEMGPGGPGQIPSGPRTSSPNLTDGGTQNLVAKPEVPVPCSSSLSPSVESEAMNPNSLSFPSPPMIRAGLLPGPRHRGAPPPRGPYGPGPLPPNHMVGPIIPRDYPPGPFPPPPGSGHFAPGPPLPPHTLRDFPPPHLLRDFPPLGLRGFPPGPRSVPPGPTPPPGVNRDFPPGPDVRR